MIEQWIVSTKLEGVLSFFGPFATREAAVSWAEGRLVDANTFELFLLTNPKEV